MKIIIFILFVGAVIGCSSADIKSKEPARVPNGGPSSGDCFLYGSKAKFAWAISKGDSFKDSVDIWSGFWKTPKSMLEDLGDALKTLNDFRSQGLCPANNTRAEYTCVLQRNKSRMSLSDLTLSISDGSVSRVIISGSSEDLGSLRGTAEELKKGAQCSKVEESL